MSENSTGRSRHPQRMLGISRLCWLVFYGASLAGIGLAISSLSQGLRAVMDIGGSCGDDPTYGFYQPCPDGAAGAIMWGVFGGLFAVGVSVLAGWRARVPQLGILAWPAMFGVLGWNFLEYGWRNTITSDGLVTSDSSLITCGLLFEAMAVIPVLVVLYFATAGRRHMIDFKQRTSVAPTPVSLVKY